MSSVNKVVLLGRLGKDPELSATPSGQSVCKMSVATEEQWTDKQSGERQKRTEWHKIVVWGRTGEAAADHLKKGQQVYLEGKIRTRSWDDKQTGEKRYMTEIVADLVVFLGGGQGERGEQEERHGGGWDGGRANRDLRTPAQRSHRQDDPGPEDFGAGGGDDDVPF